MAEEPDTLQDICFQKICDNFDVVFKKVHISEVEPEDADALLFVAEWNHIPKLLSREFSEKLFHFLVKNCRLNDSTISVFHPKCTELKKVAIKGYQSLTPQGFSILGHHKLVSFSYEGIMPFENIIAALDKEATKSITSFTFTKNTTSGYSDYKSIIKLTNVKELNLYQTKFSSVNLQSLCVHVRTINSLNLANTFITQMHPLLNFKEHLTSLTVELRQFYSTKQIIDVFSQLNNLTYLDISFSPESNERFQKPFTRAINRLLDQTTLLPNLVHLDLSGIQEIVNLIPFVLSHEQLQFLGLVNTHWCSNDMFSKPEHENYRPDLQVAGDANQRQLLASLRMYPQKCNMLVPYMDRLKRLYVEEGHPFLHPLSEILELVLSIMENHPKHRWVANMCIDFISYLILEKATSPISTGILSRVVDASIKAVAIFYSCTHIALCSLTLINSEQILRLKKIRFSLILFDSLCSYFMKVNINCVEHRVLTDYGKKVRVVMPDCESKLVNYMLDQLNQEDDSFGNRKKSMLILLISTHCVGALCDPYRSFLELGGIQILIPLLDFVIHKFLFLSQDNLFIPLFFNFLEKLAEDAELRPYMVVPEFLLKLKLLLESTTDESFYAAVVLAFLADVNETIWNDETFPNHSEISRTNVLKLLRKTIARWGGSMFSLKELQSFNPLLLMTNKTVFQLTYLAVWTMYQCCKINTARTFHRATFCQGWLDALKQIPHYMIADEPEIGRLRSVIFGLLGHDMFAIH